MPDYVYDDYNPEMIIVFIFFTIGGCVMGFVLRLVIELLTRS